MPAFRMIQSQGLLSRTAFGYYESFSRSLRIVPVALASLPLRLKDSSVIARRNARPSNTAPITNSKFEERSTSRKHSPQRLRSPPPLSFITLAAVPALWGTYGVAVKSLVDHPLPIPIPLLNFVGYLFALLALLIARQSEFRTNEGTVPGGWWNLYLAAAELGLYLFAGAVLNLLALEKGSIARVAFLVQTTAIMVPGIEMFLGKNVPPRISIASILAVFGVAVILRHGPGVPLSVLFEWPSMADVYALAAALFYSVHVVRLSRISPSISSTLLLVRSKAIVQTFLSTLLLPTTPPSQYVEFWQSLDPSTFVSTFLLLAWIGIGPTAMATVLQVEAQRIFSPSMASVAFSSQPVWSSIFAIASGEHLRRADLIGGALILVATLLVVVPTKREEDV